jgi:hypothetical protein
LGRKCLHRIAGSPSTQVAGSAAAVVGSRVGGGDNEAVTGEDRGWDVECLPGGLGGVVSAGDSVARRVQEAPRTRGPRLTMQGR